MQLSAAPTPECSYTEDLLGYLAGRAHFQLVATLQNVLKTQQLNEQQFFILSVLSIQDSLTLEEINQFVEYTGGAVSIEEMAKLEELQHVVLVQKNGDQCYVLTADGRDASLKQIAVAKAVEEQIAKQIGHGDVEALKILLKRVIKATDLGLPDLWATKEENNAKKTAS